MNAPISVNIARALFVLICCVMGIMIALGFDKPPWLGALTATAFGLGIVFIDTFLKDFTIRGFSSGTFGLMVGLFCAWLVTRVDFFDNAYFRSLENATELANIFQLCIYGALGFLGTTLGLRSNTEEFSFVIPYVRFRRESVQDQPLLVDTNIIIDGRIPRICETGFLGGHLVVPRFVVDELHVLADSHDPIKRERGRRGLDCLNEMQASELLHVTIDEAYLPKEKHVDTKLIQLAKQLDARILTNDANLGQVARLRGVPVLNLIELSKAMRPVVIPGDELELSLIKEGKDRHQAVGYLPDGTMIVVNHAANRLGTTVDVVVTSALQTSAGRLVFAELRENAARKGHGPGGPGQGAGARTPADDPPAGKTASRSA